MSAHPPRRPNGRGGRGPQQSAGLLLAALLGLGLAACMDTRPPTSNEPPAAPAFGMASGGLALSGELLDIAQSSWTLTKTGAVDAAAHTVTWTITATKSATTSQLTVRGALMLTNPGKGSATLGNVVVNLQTKAGNEWTTVASDVADASHGDAATTAHVDPHGSSEGLSSFTEGAGSGTLKLTEAGRNAEFGLVPEPSVAPADTLRLVVAATFDNAVLKLGAATAVRAEVLVSFGNASAGGSSAQGVDINGNGSIDADEANVKSVPTRLGGVVPPEATSPPTLSDAESDITTTGTVAFSAPSFDLGSSPAKASAHYDGGAEGGTIRNCAHLTGEGVDLEACDTETIAAERTCTPGTVGCGWEDGDMTTYAQASWGDGTGTAAVVLFSGFAATFPGGAQVGMAGAGGYLMKFNSPLAVENYLPASGPVGALTGDLVDPTSSSSGQFGGHVLALQMDASFSDSGALPGVDKFGDLLLCNFTSLPLMNGLTVRTFLSDANTALGGGSSIYPISDLDPAVAALATAFSGGTATTYAQDHVFAGACPAGWKDGDLKTYDQGAYGTGGIANSILVNNAGSVYGGVGGFRIGTLTGFWALWTDITVLSEYMPASGPPGALDADLLDPITTSAGVFGGNVAALELNVDFSDADVLTGAAPVKFGDLTLCNFTSLPALNNTTVRQFLATVNTLVGGGSTTYTIADLNPVAAQLNAAFYDGVAGTFAQEHLFNGACPP
jgi:hypothetical protein